jgi:hypothetical protein
MNKIALGAALLLAQPAAAFDPALNGFQRVFDDEFFSIQHIDTEATGKPGFYWYVTKWNGCATTPPTDYSIDADGLTIINQFISRSTFC